MRNTVLEIVLVFCLFFFGFGAAQARQAAVQQAQSLLLSRQKQDLEQAWHLLQNCVGPDAQEGEVLCLFAEISFYYGDWLDKPEQIQLWQEGQTYAERAALLDPQRAEAYYWSAVLMGKIGRAQGVLRSLFLVDPMLERLELVLQLDPSYSWAYFALSQMYQEMPGRPWGRGDKAQALALAEKAWELEPGEPEFCLHYARLLAENEREEEARQILLEFLKRPSVSWEEHLQEEALKLYRALKVF